MILYELTTGAWINGKTPPRAFDSIRAAHLASPIPAPATLNKNLPDKFSRMILWALRRNPEDRLKTATELTSSLALAAGVPPDKIPPRAEPKTAPVISAALSAWEFLPPPKTKTVGEDTIPLDERLASLSAPKKKTPARPAFVPILLFVIIAGFSPCSSSSAPQTRRRCRRRSFSPNSSRTSRLSLRPRPRRDRH